MVCLWGYFFVQEQNLDFANRHDLKRELKCYGDFEDSGGSEDEED